MTELKPCPFCGGESKIYVLSTVNEHEILSKIFKIKCERCGATQEKAFRIYAQIHNDGTCIFDKKEKDKAIEAWNRRADNESVEC